MNLEEYEEVETTIGEIQEGDLVFGTDGEWHSCTLLPIQNKDMYTFSTERGNIYCSWDHQWNLYKEEKYIGTYSAVEIHNQFEKFVCSNVGEPDGPILIACDYLEEDNCRCLEVDSEDHQFEVITDEGERIFTHNCQARMVCGRVDSTASLMALGNTLGTAIDGNIKGRGILSTNGVMANMQIFYEDTDWIDKWNLKRGLDIMGYPQEGLEEQEILLGENEEEISIGENMMTMDFEGIHKEINNAKRQEFDNV